MDREAAYALLTEYTKSEQLVKHGLAVEAVMRNFARRAGEDEETWGIVGLLHDFDYEIHPTAEEHPALGTPILEEHGYPPDVVYAIRAHGDHLGLPRTTPMAKTLFAVDELTGFVIAVALVKPNKSLAEVDAASVHKKLKDKAFARAVNRADITKGIDELGVDFEEHVTAVIQALEPVADLLGLAGKTA